MTSTGAERGYVLSPAGAGDLAAVEALLLENGLPTARDTGVRAMYLLTTTAEDYFPAFGFTRVPRESVPAELLGSEEFRGACPDSAVVMFLELRSVHVTEELPETSIPLSAARRELHSPLRNRASTAAP